MNLLREYWNLALSGFAEMIKDHKYLALIVGILIFGYVCRKKWTDAKARQFWLYGAGGMLLLAFPVTGMFFLIYQTRFYDYGWVWSFVPLTAILAWGITEIVFGYLEPGTMIGAEKLKEKWVLPARILGLLAAASILFMFGNQGRLQAVSQEELQVRSSSEKILAYLEEQELVQNKVLWAPRGIMQYLRSHSGEVTLFYGRDMWDGKAGAYDYEAYEEVEVSCYEWMECVSSSLNLYLLQVEQAPEAVHEALASERFLLEAVTRGVDVTILPTQITPWMERKMQLTAQEQGYSVSAVMIDEYTVWLFE